MSPYLDSDRLGVDAPPSASLPPPGSGVGDAKQQRKLKQQRDAARRHKNEALLRARRQPPHAHQQRVDRDLPLVKASADRSIPSKRKDKPRGPSASSLSRSLPSAESWPPAAGADAFADKATDDALSSSVPKDSFLSGSYGRRGARTMTLFESASFYNESGHLLSHDNLDELGSSPDMPGSAKQRKPKRRVGRRKNEAKRHEMLDLMNQDEVVLELMCVLLPDLDVGKELNLRLLGGGGHQHSDDVFHFDDDDELSTQQPSNNDTICDVDVLKFQAALTNMVFGSHQPSSEDMPPRGTAPDELLEKYLSDQWVAKTVLEIVRLDVLAQYDNFSILSALFRTCPERRVSILNAMITASLAIFEYQGMNTLSPADNVKFVSMKGTVKFLNEALAVVEESLQVSPEQFGDSPDEIDDNVMALCGRVSQALKLLVRCSPGSSRRKDENANQIEKFSEASESAEATTYRSLGELMYRLATFCPILGEDALRWMLQKWPTRNVQLELFFVRFTAGILSTFVKCGLRLPYDVVQRAFKRIQDAVKSPQFLIAKEACTVCGNIPLMEMYLSQDPSLRSKVAAALHENATSHWNDRVRAMSDECFDMLLDLA